MLPLGQLNYGKEIYLLNRLLITIRCTCQIDKSSSIQFFSQNELFTLHFIRTLTMQLQLQRKQKYFLRHKFVYIDKSYGERLEESDHLS